MKSIRVIVLFAISGAIGFAVDSVILYLLKGSLGLYYARGVSFFCAVFATWLVNRKITFKGRKSGLSKRQEFSRYLALMLGGGLVNYLVYAALIGRFAIARNWPVIGVAAGSLAGMGINLISSRFLIYRFSARKAAD